MPLADMVASLEKRVSLLEPGRLEKIGQRAQLARAELESLGKARSASSALGGGGGVGGAKALDYAKKVEEAYSTLQSWEAVSAGLPSLVERLRTLEALHRASTSFTQRLDKVWCAAVGLALSSALFAPNPAKGRPHHQVTQEPLSTWPFSATICGLTGDRM
ncbi:unnamed protein product [Discosporangium mesarthrocarpum]